MKEFTGTWLRPDGTPAAGAKLGFVLSQDAVAEDGSATLGHYPVEVTLDETGSINSGSLEGIMMYANDELLPSGTTYVVWVRDPQFGRIYFERLSIVGESPINLNAIAPALQ